MSKSAYEPVVGIDLGTTFSVVAHQDAQGRPTTVLNAEGDLTTPSVVFLDKDDAVVGKDAVKAAEFEPERLAAYPKRDMGQQYFHLPVRNQLLRPEVLQALVLRKLKHDAEQKLGPLRKAVITVPAYFNEPRRKATQDAGRMAGWEVLDIINEPTAAAIAYGVHAGFLSPTAVNETPETILVYDLGGGTFDVTLMRVEINSFATLATAGDVELGGIDWDNRLVDHIAELFEKEHAIDPRKDHAALHRLRREAEEIKRSLSSRHEVTFAFAHDGHKLRTTITRDQFENLTGDLVDRTLMTIRKLLREAKVEYKDLTRLLMVGGSTRMPMIKQMLERETGLLIDQSLSVDEAVAHGAAIYAHFLTHQDTAEAAPFRVVNVNSHTLGVLGIDPVTKSRRRKVMIPRNTSLPAKHTQRFGTAERGQRSVAVVVVEGGDDSGNNATLIGKCLLENLGADLPPRSPVDVTFHYGEDGRLNIHAAMPTIGKESSLTIDRTSGMSEELLTKWTACVAQGLADALTLPEDVSLPPLEARPGKGVALPDRDEAAASAPAPKPAASASAPPLPSSSAAQPSPESNPAPKAAESKPTEAKSDEKGRAYGAPPPSPPPPSSSAPPPSSTPKSEAEKKSAAAPTPAAPTKQPAPPASAPAPAAAEKKPAEPTAPKIGEPPDESEAAEAGGEEETVVVVNKRRKKKKPVEGEAAAEPPKKKGWKFW